MKAVLDNFTLAESTQARSVDGQIFFPPDSINAEFFELSDTHSVTPGKGKAGYFHIQLGEKRYPDAAWFFPHPEAGSEAIRDCVTFGKEVEIRE